MSSRCWRCTSYLKAGRPDLGDVGEVSRDNNSQFRATATSSDRRAVNGAAPLPTLAERIDAMLYTIAVILLILWALGLVTSYTMGGFIHLLLVIAIVIVLLRLISGRAVV
jgi:hypothetical protein